jgi:hypothetical protein
MALAPMQVTASAELTPLEVKELPFSALAHRALGESGALMLDVERPSSNTLSYAKLRFFGRARATGAKFGICRTDWLTLEFDEKGKIQSLETERRYGLEAPIYRKAGDWTYDGFDALCASAKTTRQYFPAPSALAAWEIAVLVDATLARGPSSKQSFGFVCSGVCKGGREELSELRLEEIDSARPIPCRAPEELACYELVVGADRIGLFPKTFRIYGASSSDAIAVHRVEVDVSSSLN